MATVEEAEAERQVKVSAAADKAVKVLNALVQKAKSVEARRAIDDEILTLSKVGLCEAKSASPWVGTYRGSLDTLSKLLPDGSASVDSHRGIAKNSACEGCSGEVRAGVIAITPAAR